MDGSTTTGLEHALLLVAKRVLKGPAVSTGGTPLDRWAYWVLARVEEAGDLRLTELAAALELDVSTVSRQVRQLEDAALLRRRPDPADGRAARLELTALGQRELRAVRATRRRLLETAMADWPERDRDRLAVLLQRLADDLDDPTPSTPDPGASTRRAAPRWPTARAATARPSLREVSR